MSAVCSGPLMNPPARPSRESLIKELRRQGYTYEALAYELHRQGFTDWEVSKVRVWEMVKDVAPELMGNIKQKLQLPRLIHRKDLTNEG